MKMATTKLAVHVATIRSDWASCPSTVSWSREKRLTMRPEGVVSNQRVVEWMTELSIRLWRTLAAL